MTVHAQRDRLVDLVVAHATEGLSDLDLRIMEDLNATFPDVDPASFERTAAVIDILFDEEETEQHEPLPGHLTERLRIQANAWRARDQAPQLPLFAPTRASWAPWALAAAAAIVVVLLVTSDSQPPSPSPMERMVALMAVDDIVRADWNEASEGVLPETSGDVVWSDRKQEGYMRFRGLPSNDPTKTQYQLWIVDPSRDERPVDGGVFDVAPGTSEVVVPIDSKLLVNGPKAFVLTSEKPGGVVVSDGPFLLIAKP